MKNKEAIENTIKIIIKELQPHIDCERLGSDTDFIAELNIDSIVLMQILFEIEDQFDIVLDEEDMEIDNLSTVAKLSKLIQIKLNDGE